MESVIGVNLDVEVMDWAQYLKELKVANDKGNTEWGPISWVGNRLRAKLIILSVRFLRQKILRQWAGTRCFIPTPAWMNLMVLAGKTLDDKKRSGIFQGVSADRCGRGPLGAIVCVWTN